MFKRRRVCDIRHSSAEEQVQAHTQTFRRDPRSAAKFALRLRWWSIVQRTNAGAPNAMRGCDEAPQSVLTHSVRSGTLRGPRSVLFSARTDFAAKPPREQSSREGARADARRNAQSSSGGAKRKLASGRAAAGVDANTLHFPCRVLRNSPCGCDGGGAGS